MVLMPPEEQEALEGSKRSSFRILQEGDSVSQLSVTDANEAAGAVCMPGEELCGGVHDNVHAQQERLAYHRRHHRAVHAEQNPMLVREICESFKISDAHPWV
eukprot:CAMPEP_0115151742 /NCGR_PEP_ID=MMETSP0227-20121206/65767_1 /TAXON_ID=89957 /ORGANISM="Polarella glacialis, Strain CCMP 1383" /LENGTH=101 /DNA_ID=CAMNT_0002562259 /DNA_START=330 /DNA_END=634 /DNA_ORIENTATION=+